MHKPGFDTEDDDPDPLELSRGSLKEELSAFESELPASFQPRSMNYCYTAEVSLVERPTLSISRERLQLRA